MMRLLSRFEERAQAAVAQGIGATEIGSLGILRQLQRMGEEIAEGEGHRFEVLANDIEHAFHGLTAKRNDALGDPGESFVQE
jgi:hypothetical protein